MTNTISRITLFILLFLLGYNLKSQSGAALNFNGSQYVTKTAFSLGTNWTAEAWIKPSATGGGWYSVLGQNYWNNTQGFIIRIYGNKVGLETPGGVVIDAPIVNNEWCHVAAVYNSGVFSFYKNGVLLNSIWTGFLNGSTAQLKILTSWFKNSWRMILRCINILIKIPMMGTSFNI